METLTIENPPKSLLKQFGTKVTYKTFEEYYNKQRIKKLEKKHYNEKEDNYWSFYSADEAINFLTRKRWL